MKFNKIDQQIQNRKILDPFFITGFTEADGCFYISIQSCSITKLGLRFIPTFYITQDIESEHVLYNIHNTLSLSYQISSFNFVRRKSDNTSTYTVRGVKSCKNLIQHFMKYPLQGEKRKNLLIFNFVLDLLDNNLVSESIRAENYVKIINLIFMMNNQGKTRPRTKNELFGLLSAKLNISWEKIDLISRQSINIPDISESNTLILNPWYVTGLIDGDGSFNLSFEIKPRLRIKTNFTLGMLNESKSILLNLLKFFSCGKIYTVSGKYSRYQVENIEQIEKNIIPHFKKYPLESNKKNHFLIWTQTLNSFSELNKFVITPNLKKQWFLENVERAYNMNCNGKRRKYTKEEIIKQINEMKV